MTSDLLPLPKVRDALVIPQVSWEQFEAIEASFESISGVRFAYLEGWLEIMPISPEHEEIKTTLRLLLEAYLRLKGIRFYSRGGPTLGDRQLGARSEPDESYNLETRKSFPDLVIEVVITSGGIDKLAIYQRLGVTEVWFWEDGLLTLFRLRGQHYERINQSELLPDLPLDLICRYVLYFDQYDAVTEFLAAISSEP